MPKQKRTYKIKKTGEELECRAMYYHNETIGLWNEDKSDWNVYDFSDVKEVTPIKSICIGDEVEWVGNWYEVTGYIKYDGEWSLVVKSSICDKNYLLRDYEIEDYRTIPTETLKIGDKVYNKSEVEEALKDIKAI